MELAALEVLSIQLPFLELDRDKIPTLTHAAQEFAELLCRGWDGYYTVDCTAASIIHELKRFRKATWVLGPLNQSRFTMTDKWGRNITSTFSTLSRIFNTRRTRRFVKQQVPWLNPGTYGRLYHALKRVDRGRAESSVTGIISNVLLATKFKAIQDVETFYKLKKLLFYEAFEDPTRLVKRYKRFVRLVQVSLCESILHPTASSELEDFLSKWEVARLIWELPGRPDHGLEPSMEELWYIGHLCQSRNLPGPTLKESYQEIYDLMERLTSGTQPSREQCDTFAAACFALGQNNRSSKFYRQPKETHISLSNSACIEYTRKEGGKFAALWNEIRDFLETPIYMLESCKTVVRERTTYIADKYGNILCAEEDGHHHVWRCAYLSEPLKETTFLELQDNFEKEYQGNLTGVDCRLGTLLFLFAIEEHHKWCERGKPPPHIQAVPISEPGGKARIATKSPLWVNLFLSPAGHYIKDTLVCIPGARIGLEASDQLWNYEASFGRHADRWPEDKIYGSTSDLEAATDHLGHEMSRVGLRAYLAGLDESSLYLDEAVELCTSSRILQPPTVFRNRLRRQWIRKATSKGFPDGLCETNRGILMGEPLTKGILTLWSCAAELSARSNWSYPTTSLLDFARGRVRRSHFACCGDDHTGLGDVKYLTAIPKRLEYWGAVVNYEKYMISKRYISYCQDWAMVFRRGPKYAIHESGPRFTLDKIHSRLMCDRRKVTPNSFEEPNPLPGKMKDLRRKVEYHRSSGLNLMCLLLAKYGMGRWLRAEYLSNPSSYIASQYGGKDLPHLLGGMEFHALPPWHLMAIKQRHLPYFARALQGHRSRKERGVITPLSRRFEEAAVLPTKTFREVDAEIREREMSETGSVISYKQVYKRLAKQYYNLEVLDLLEKKVKAHEVAFDERRFTSRRSQTLKPLDRRYRDSQREMREIYEDWGRPQFSPEEVVASLPLSPADEGLYVEKSALQGLLEWWKFPALIFPRDHLYGRAGRIDPGSLPILHEESVDIEGVGAGSVCTTQDGTSSNPG